MAYIGQTLTEGTRRAYTFVATAGQTTFNAVYGVGAVDVYQNGILLQPSDYNSSSGSSVVLGVGAAVNDEITIIAHNTFSVADTVSSSQGGTFSGAVTASNGLTVDDAGATPLTVDRATNDGAIIDVQKDGTSVGTIGAAASNRLYIGNGDAGIRFLGDANLVTPWRPDTNANSDNLLDLGNSANRWKDVYVGGGVYLGGTGAANKLDDYEEGTFTPFLNAMSQNPTYYAQEGRYTKVGRACTVFLKIGTNTLNGGTGAMSIGGLPFTQANGPYGLGSFFGIIGWEDRDTIVAQFTTNASTMELYAFIKYAGTNYASITNADLHNNGGANVLFSVQATYEVQ